MQFSTYALAALSVASAAFAASSDVTVHVITVSGTTSVLTFTPNNVTANVGDMLQFQFGVGNHTVTQSDFDHPCTPLGETTAAPGLFSGFMPVAAGAKTIPTYTVLVNSTTPMWIYCSQAKHCQSGMVMVVNENTKANATRSLANYKTAAAKATANLAPGAISNGTDGTTTNSTENSGSSGTSTGNSTSSSTGSSASSTSSGSGAASGYQVPALSGLLGLAAAALFL